MRYQYFGGWHRYYREPIDPLSEAEAQQRHSNGHSYCVVAREDGDEPVAFVEVSSDFFSVNLLDEEGRVYLTYGFEDVGTGQLFSQIRHSALRAHARHVVRSIFAVPNFTLFFSSILSLGIAPVGQTSPHTLQL